MKNRIFGLLSICAIIFGFNSCKEEIELTGDFEETAVVFGLLDQSESIHMIKITRAFIGPGNAIEIAAIADSSYFQSVTGTVTEYINNIPSGRIFTLTDTMILNKDENGIFYGPEQKMYYFETATNTPLLGAAEYQLDLDINNGEFQVSSRTEMVDNITENITSQNSPFGFIQSDGDLTSTFISINTGNSYQINAKLKIDFTEWVGTVATQKSFIWQLGESQTIPGEDISFTAGGETFYNLIKDRVTNDPAITKRTLDGITTIVTGGAQDFFNFILVNEPSSTLAQSKPTFTNLTATNGHPVVGIFSARQSVNVYDPFVDPSGSLFRSCLKSASREELCIGTITSGLLFCSGHPADINDSWYCN